MPDPTDPRAVADDPSGIVQQMPDGGDEGLKPCPFCGAPAEIVHIDGGELAGGSCVTCTRCLACSNVEFEFKENFVSNWNRRATEADLRAELERLRAQVKQKSAALRRAEAFIGKGTDRVGPLLREIRAALSPETDGGQ